MWHLPAGLGSDSFVHRQENLADGAVFVRYPKGGSKMQSTQHEINELEKRLTAQFEQRMKAELDQRLKASGQGGAGAGSASQQQPDFPEAVKKAKAAATKLTEGWGSNKDQNRYEEDKNLRSKALEERKP
jgi:hypothetical protein